MNKFICAKICYILLVKIFGAGQKLYEVFFFNLSVFEREKIDLSDEKMVQKGRCNDAKA